MFHVKLDDLLQKWMFHVEPRQLSALLQRSIGVYYATIAAFSKPATPEFLS